MKSPAGQALRISVGLVSIAISLIFSAYSIGLIPSDHQAALEMRAKTCENLAVQLASSISRNDEIGIRDTIYTVLKRNSDILSIAVRGADGKLLVDPGRHDALWREPADGKSTETFIQVPLLDGERPRGKIEFVFKPLKESRSGLGPWVEIAGLISFIGGASFLSYFLFLTGVLRKFASGQVIPERVKTAYDTLAEGVLILDDRGIILLANEAFEKNICGNSGSPVGADARTLPWLLSDVAGDIPWETAMRKAEPVLGFSMGIRGPAGELRKLVINATPIPDNGGGICGAIATFDDVTALQRTNEQLNDSIHQLHLSQARISEQNRELQILASCDPLTGCLNRRTFLADAERLLEDARSHQQPTGFLMLDADHFKRVNDRFGHAVGDKVLVGLAAVIKRVCGEKAAIGRYGGEEFCAAVSGLADREMEALAERLRRAVSEVRTWLPNGEAVTISIGIALADLDSSVSDLIKRADSALYTAKANGRNRYVAWKDVELLNGEPDQLRAAIRDRRLYCEFQPKIEIGSQEVVGFEVLVRWRSDGGRGCQTEELIRKAIEFGLINEVTHFVLESAIRSVDRLDAAFGPKTSISINVAAKLANDLDFMLQFVRALSESGIADRLIIELTEESLITKGDFHTKIIPLLHEIGVRVSIDDFGTGYSSLSLLADIMADEIKIDRSFISRIHERHRNQSILRAINSLARSLNMNIVAEGVETFEELAFLQASTTIRQVQGFYFSRPFELDEVENVKDRLSIGRAFPAKRVQAPVRTVNLA